MTRLIAVGGVVGISFSAIFVALSGASPSSSAFLRMAIAAPLLLALAWRRGALRDLDPAGVRFALVAGAVFALNVTVWHYNIEVVGTGLSTLMGNAQVIFVGLLAWEFYGERPTRLAIGAIPVMLGAVALVAGLAGGDATVQRPWLGAGLGILTAALNASWLLLLREATRRTRRPLAALAILTLAAAVVAFVAGVVTDPGFSLRLPWEAYAWLAALALISQVFGWLFITPALGRLPALAVAVLLLLQPSLTLLWGALIFGESHGLSQWLGVAVLLGGIALLNVRGTTRPAAVPVQVAREG